ncbi:MAG: J domain-containing protein [Candidatus Solibacter usitatus]|nr:J domain-containing protein [Candidatus Solibacter usitatus]
MRAQPLELCLSYEDGSGVRQVVAAWIVDAGDQGIGIQSRLSLPVGSIATLRAGAELINSGIYIAPKGRVCWCSPGVGGLYRAGLEFEGDGEGAGVAGVRLEADLDHYEILQISPKADPDTIHRVFRLLAQRFHPDNAETGNEEAFKRISRAYMVLGDPANRASYDMQRAAILRANWRVFHSPEAAREPDAERSKRAAVLRALYQKRLMEPHAPAMSVFEIEDLLEIPREHLEFTLWYVKERGLVTRSDNNRYQITVAGVDQAEQESAGGGARIQEDRLLPAASG